MSALRRLSEEDVKLVFDCVFNNHPPPPTLSFQIIIVGSNGMKLSPPSYEYKEGLYILLRPLKKSKGDKAKACRQKIPENDIRIPSRLQNLVMKETPPETCPWSLSGPQFPLPTGIQQRYCYPKGNPEYSHGKGGALWTVYFDHGKEDLEYRLLHVYHSPKRAGNCMERASRENLTPIYPEFSIPAIQEAKAVQSNTTWSSISSSLTTDSLEIWEGTRSSAYRYSNPTESVPSPLPYQMPTLTPMDPSLPSYLSPHEETMCSMLLFSDQESHGSDHLVHGGIRDHEKSQRRQRKRRNNVPQAYRKPMVEEERLSQYPIQESNRQSWVQDDEDDSTLSPWIQNLEDRAQTASQDISHMMELQTRLEAVYSNIVREWIFDGNDVDMNSRRTIMERKGHLVTILVDWAKMIVENPLMTVRDKVVVDGT